VAWVTGEPPNLRVGDGREMRLAARHGAPTKKKKGFEFVEVIMINRGSGLRVNPRVKVSLWPV